MHSSHPSTAPLWPFLQPPECVQKGHNRSSGCPVASPLGSLIPKPQKRARRAHPPSCTFQVLWGRATKGRQTDRQAHAAQQQLGAKHGSACECAYVTTAACPKMMHGCLTQVGCADWTLHHCTCPPRTHTTHTRLAQRYPCSLPHRAHGRGSRTGGAAPASKWRLLPLRAPLPGCIPALRRVHRPAPANKTGVRQGRLSAVQTLGVEWRVGKRAGAPPPAPCLSTQPTPPPGTHAAAWPLDGENPRTNRPALSIPT